jgi:hypothetical protein
VGTQRAEAQAKFLAGRTAQLRAIKLEQGCVDCGYREAAEALDFDHRPEERKLFNPGRRAAWAWDRVMAEVAKCDVRCANCHRIMTRKRRET